MGDNICFGLEDVAASSSVMTDDSMIVRIQENVLSSVTFLQEKKKKAGDAIRSVSDKTCVIYC